MCSSRDASAHHLDVSPVSEGGLGWEDTGKEKTYLRCMNLHPQCMIGGEMNRRLLAADQWPRGLP